MNRVKQTEVGNVTITAELHDTDPETLETETGVAAKYGYLSDKLKEHFYAVFLNGANEQLAEKLIGLGTAAGAEADISDIVRTAALVNARAVILVHNHPSGTAKPTDQDIDVTRQIRDALDLIEVDLLDHVIIGDSHHSMRSNSDLSFNE